MNFSDIIFVFQWWLVFFVIGVIFLPLTTRVFSVFFDKGYIFSKILGIVLISYSVFLLGVLKIAPFTELTIGLTIAGFLVFNIILIIRLRHSGKRVERAHPESLRTLHVKGDSGQDGYQTVTRQARMTISDWKIFLFEEVLFLTTLFFWSYIRAHLPDIHGLEKYMDFGFTNSIIRSEYFPPVDMWFTPLPINYYYFGHLTTAFLTKISTLPSFVTYNLMLATIFAFTFTASFSIGANLIHILNSKRGVTRVEGFPTARTFVRSKARLEGALAGGKRAAGPRAIIAGLITGFLVSMVGNLHAIYAFFKPYVSENPVPFWQLPFALDSFPNAYWYPNATRFIYNTIHEFPIYSAVVSDLHGHYLDVPFVLLTIAVLLTLIFNFQFFPRSGIFTTNFNQIKIFQFSNFNFQILLLAFLLAIMYMTNAWDGIIYFLLASLVLLFISIKQRQTSPMEIKNEKLKIKNSLKIENLKLIIVSWLFCISIIAVGFFIFALPFNLFFKPFASGIGVLCAPGFLTNMGNFGPFLFEADHCQHSPWWQLLILYGFFYFWAISFFFFLFKKKEVVQNSKFKIQNSKFKIFNFKLKLLTFNFGLLTKSDIFVMLLIIFSTFLILIPEFIYVKDIYPGHYRANTMFKLSYQAFIMLSISSGYIIVRIISQWKMENGKWKIGYWIIGIIGLLLVSIYPYFAINSYYGELKTYRGLDGLAYLRTLYPTDYEAILWINKNIKEQPVILEAQGDSYTDYGRVSANTGLPTVLGWTVHEWLWRGKYDIPAPRIPEVQKMYESDDLEETKSLMKKYEVSLVFFGDLEREKYPNLDEDKFKTLGKVIYENGNTKIYDIIGL